MADYDSLAKLRAALTSDDAEARSSAYSAVLSNDIRPNDVLDDDPPVEELQDAGVIPSSPDRMGRDDKLDRIIELLEEISGSGGGQ